MFAIDEVIRNALREDIGAGDVTTRVTVDAATSAQGELLAKEEFLVAGLEVARRVFSLVDAEIRFDTGFRDGMAVAAGQVFALVSGRAVSILQGERVALNFLQRLSGIATLTRQFVKAVEGTKASIVDTRKTTPGLRMLEKYAVRVGGGRNHRFSLADGILIKENHSRAAGGIAVAVGRALRDATAFLNAALGDVAFNVGFHSAPHDHTGEYHWHVHIWPNLVTQAGFERGTGVIINIVPPEQAAEQLRAASALTS